MDKLRYFVFVTLIFAAFKPTASAFEEPGFLPVDEAFQLSVRWLDDGRALLRWGIAPGYYLYKDRIKVSGEGLRPAVLPSGKMQDDEFFGRVETYENELRLPVTVEAERASYRLDVSYQGCAKAGLCYSPQNRQLDLLSPSGAAAVDAAAPNVSQPTKEADDQRLARYLAERTPLLNLLLFFGLGVLLVFTPCVLPMVPILSSMLAGSRAAVNSKKGLLVSSVYVLAMALSYAVAGVAAALGGASVQASLQRPEVLAAFSLLFVALALSMFGLYELQLPARIRSYLDRFSQKQSAGSLSSAAVMGVLSALVVSPCVAPPLAGALLYVARSGDAFFGGAALFALGLGMGAPLLIVGTVLGGFLPRAGAWMQQVKWFFGFLLLGLAVWLFGRVLPLQQTTAMWAALGLGVALWLGFFKSAQSAQVADISSSPTVVFWVFLKRWIALALGFWSLLALLGVAAGSSGGIWQPLKGAFVSEVATTTQSKTSSSSLPFGFHPVRTLDGLRAELARSDDPRPVLLDIYADWCVSCKVLEQQIFPKPEVRAAMASYRLLRADVTANDEADLELLRAYEIIGPPSILFFDLQGQEQRWRRIVGEISALDLAVRLNQL